MNKKPKRKFTIGQFFERKVMRVGTVYVLVGWILMQIGEVTFEALNLPPWALTLLIVITVLGFPIALILAWAYEVTPEGIIRHPADAKKPVSKPATAIRPMPSIAVLPFDDMSERGDQAHFCEGLAEEILNALCKMAHLQVASRMASFQFRSKRTDVTEIGEKLKVQSVLEGSVRQFGDNLRITAQLVDTSNGFHLWTRQFDRHREDLFQIQEEVAEQIVYALSVTLKHHRFGKQDQADPRAYDFFLRGKHYFAQSSVKGAANARKLFRRALEIDPEYGLAWAWLAYTYGFEYINFDVTQSSRKEALKISAKALELAPGLAETHLAAGLALCMTGNCQQAESEFKKSIEIDPKNFNAWYFYGRAQVHDGDLAKALELFQEAARVRPEDYQSVLLQAQLYVSLGDQMQAMEASQNGVERARTALDFAPDDTRAYNMGAIALQRLGHLDEAAQWMNESVKSDPNDPVILYNATCFHAALGETERALEFLEKCLLNGRKTRRINRYWLDNDSDLDSLRQHPRFVEITAR
jgi:adenylate cyclase